MKRYIIFIAACALIACTDYEQESVYWQYAAMKHKCEAGTMSGVLTRADDGAHVLTITCRPRPKT